MKLFRFITPQARHAKWLLLIALLVLGVMTYFGYQEQIKAVLNDPRVTYKIGSFKLSPYIFIKSLVTIVLLFWTAGVVVESLSHQIQGVKGLKQATRSLIAKFLQISIYILCGIISLRSLGIDLTALAVFSGAIGIGLGFGLQKVTSNFISGIILLFERTLQVGDLIELGTGIQGTVRHMGARYTQVETSDGKDVMIPNEEFITSRLTNLTYSNRQVQVEILLSVAREADLHLAQRLMLEAAAETPRVLPEPSPACLVTKFTESGTQFALQFWLADVVEGRAVPKSDLHFAIWRKFREHGISFAAPHRDVYFKGEQLPTIGSE